MYFYLKNQKLEQEIFKIHNIKRQMAMIPEGREKAR
jgi:hypothetical protein